MMSGENVLKFSSMSLFELFYNFLRFIVLSHIYSYQGFGTRLKKDIANVIIEEAIHVEVVQKGMVFTGVLVFK